MKLILSFLLLCFITSCICLPLETKQDNAQPQTLVGSSAISGETSHFGLTSQHASTNTEQCATCTNCRCNGGTICPVSLEFGASEILAAVEYCEPNQVPAIGKINIVSVPSEGSDTVERFSYYLVDNLRTVENSFKTIENQNCSTDHSYYRLPSPGNAYLVVKATVNDVLQDPLNLKYSIKTLCVTPPANDVTFHVESKLAKYYTGNTVSLTITFMNALYQTVDTYLNGIIYVTNSKVQQVGKVEYGIGKIDVILGAQLPEFEFISNPKFQPQLLNSFFTFPLDLINVVRKATSGELKMKKQQVTSGKEFTVYFSIYDSDNLASPQIDIFLLEISSTTQDLICTVSTLEFGRGIATCSSETPGQSILSLKYNGVKMDELTLTIEENPNAYVQEGTALLLIVLIIICSLLLCVVVGSIGCIWYQIKKRRDLSGIKKGRQAVREEDVEELDL